LQRKKSFTKINQRGKANAIWNRPSFWPNKNEKDLPTKFQFDYEALKPYVDKVVQGQENILWKENRSILLRHLEHSGATFRWLRNRCRIILRLAILHYIHETGKADFVDGKMIFLQGSPLLEEKTE
jgi:hypothetical protein